PGDKKIKKSMLFPVIRMCSSPLTAEQHLAEGCTATDNGGDTWTSYVSIFFSSKIFPKTANTLDDFLFFVYSFKCCALLTRKMKTRYNDMR
ncbi:MAG: hypothetical protein IJX52_05940, partial [Oscillibacter sp.]|nr:hypothetical protein [Oscillibacter sp.]